MHCERAQEFFSDYLERTLDTSMAVALEAHLASCAPCKEEVEALQVVFRSLDAVPEVTPPWDGARQVIQRLREELPEPVAAPQPLRIPQPRIQAGFMPWMRSLSPASVAMGAGLATFAIAGTFMIPGVPNLVRNTFLPHPPGLQASANGGAADGARSTEGTAPSVTVICGQPSEAGYPVTLRLVSTASLPDMKVDGSGGGRRFSVTDTLSPERPVEINLTLPTNEGDAQSIWLDMTSQRTGKRFRYLVVAPVRKSGDDRVALVLENQPIELALRSLAPALGQPVIVQDAVEQRVDVNAPDPQSARSSLDVVAATAGARLTNENGSYHLSPAP